MMPLLLTARQAAELVGVDESTWNRWVRDGRVPSSVFHPATYGQPKKRRFSRAQVEAWAAGVEVAPMQGQVGSDAARLLRQLEAERASLRVERDGLRAVMRAEREAGRRLATAAREWFVANRGLASPEVRQRAVDALADALDAFDALKGDDS